MIVQFPQTTKHLWEQLEESVTKMPQKDRNMLIQDLMKFCIDWQFAYLAMKESNNGIQGR